MIEKLLKYQEIDGKLREIEVAISGSNERKRAASAQAFLKSVNENVAKLDQRAEDLTVKFSALKRLYEQLKDAESEYENVVETCEDADELGYIRKKAGELGDEIASLADQIENLSRDIAAVLKEFSALRTKTQEAKKQYAEYVPKYNALKASREAEMNEIRKELASLEKNIGKEELEKYRAKRKEKVFPVVCPVQIIGKEAHCARCGTELSMAAFGAAKRGELVECDNCQRLLYVPGK